MNSAAGNTARSVQREGCIKDRQCWPQVSIKLRGIRMGIYDIYDLVMQTDEKNNIH